jgi:hypothetical protein
MKDETPKPAERVEPEKAPYSKPELSHLGLLRTLTQGYF